MKTTTIIKNEHDKTAFVKKVIQAFIDKPLKIEVSAYKPKRSNAINRLMWMWYGEIQKHLREHLGQIHSTNDIHEYMVLKLLPKKEVFIGDEMKIIRAPTSKMNNKEMSQYLELLDHYCGAELEIRLTHPIDLYNEAMGAR